MKLSESTTSSGAGPESAEAARRQIASLLDAFAPASVDLLERRSLLRRMDSKFLVPLHALVRVLPRLQDQYLLLRAGGECLASYRTLYFDTPELTFFHDHRRGRRNRQKVRIRHYPDRQVTFLEVKTKRNPDLTEKERLKLAYGHTELGTRELEFLGRVVRTPLTGLAPAVWTNFYRGTLIGINTNERITLDLELTLQTEDKSIRIGGTSIVEVKQQPFCMTTPVVRALRDFNVRSQSASKYCAGIALTRPTVRHNRFLPMLRALNGRRRSCHLNPSVR